MGHTVADRGAAACRRLRESAGLSLAQMAELARLSSRQTWASYEARRAECDQARWELCLLLLGQHPSLRLAEAEVGKMADVSGRA